ncbi:MAG: transcriptional regulator [Solibacillus sp.]|uniref:transcriptional regulator n=1 Tax=unclassified Solibacillus TaxID=2637870 RepID=UPI0030FBF534
MKANRQAYEVYVKKCEQFGLEPVNFRYFIIQLSEQQINAYYEQAILEGIH